MVGGSLPPWKSDRLKSKFRSARSLRFTNRDFCGNLAIFASFTKTGCQGAVVKLNTVCIGQDMSFEVGITESLASWVFGSGALNP